MGKGVDEPLESSNPRQSDDGSLLVIGASSVVVVVVVAATAASIDHIHRFSLYHNLHASADAAASNSSSICNHISFISAQWQ